MPFMWKFLEIIVLALASLAMAVAAAALLGGALPGIAILGNFAAYALIAASGCTAFAAWREGRTALWTSLAAVLVNGALVLPTIAGVSSAPAGAPSMKLLMFNIHWNNKNFDGIDALIAQYDPDVVVLNEIYKNNRPGLRMLDARFPYRVECWTSWPCDTLILSRRPLRNQNMMREHDGVRIGVAQATFDIGACPVTIFAAHFNRPWPYHALNSDGAQVKQARALAELVAAWAGPRIVAGDLNAAAWTPVVREIAGAAKGRALGGLSGTWPWFFPSALKMPIDHVIVSGEIVGTRTVLPVTGSDHSPVLAELAMPGCER
jgi:endonuclease/exonuclease/phosphatase (EEP) superfamily protein YafD